MNQFQQAMKMQQAVRAFQTAVANGSIVLPPDAPALSDDNQPSWPDSLAVNQCVYQINYDPVGNVITLAS